MSHSPFRTTDPFQFRLRTLFWWIAVVGVFCGLIAAVPPGERFLAIGAVVMWTFLFALASLPMMIGVVLVIGAGISPTISRIARCLISLWLVSLIGSLVLVLVAMHVFPAQ